MLQFLKYILATVFGLFLFCLIIFVLIAGIVSTGESEKKEATSDNGILKIVLDKNISERQPDNFFGNFPGPFNSGNAQIGLLELRQVIEKAKNDKDIKGIYLHPAQISGGFGILEEVRNALIEFKKSGKFIVSYGEFFSEKAYYIASVSDKIFLPPTGLIEFNGLETELLFFKGTLEKLELQPEIFRVGSFKSAVEPFILEKMSDSNRVQTYSFINAINDQCLNNVALSRKIDFSYLKNISDSMLVRNAKDALKYQLITDLAYEDAADDFLRKKTGVKKDKKINYVSYDKYYAKNVLKDDEPVKEKNKVAVIFAEGAINSGTGEENSIGSESLVKEIRKARQDEDIKAIVLRINSPGGSALASDVIWREIVITKKIKPVIASMSDVAASGGYYLAMACDTIVAQPTTITGSIGVFGLMLNAEHFLKNKLGITTDRVTTGKFSDLGSPTRKVTAFERQIIQKEVEDIYDDFTSKAAQGRKMSVEHLRRLASGRVYSGAEAKKNGLIDIHGGLADAINIAVSKSKIKDHHVEYLPHQKNAYFRQLFAQWGEEEEEALLKKHFGSLFGPLKTIRDLEKLEGIQARLPFEITIE